MLKKIFKISGIILLSLIATVVISYFVFINNAERIVKDLVELYTDGKLQIEMKKLRFNPSELRITIEKAKIFDTDTISRATTYNIEVDTMLLEIASIKPLLFRHKIEIDSITFKRPSVAVTQWRETRKEKFSLPQQMGKVYTSLDKMLGKLSIKYCLLDSGAFSIEDKVHPERKKVVVTDFYFLINNMNKNINAGKDDRFFFSDRIKFYSSHQHITLASGNQEISYSRLRINSGRRIIELDSCFVYSKKNDNDFSSFSGYFDTLKFTSVDFKRLTQESVLDADSAYCINPRISLKTSIRKKASSSQVMSKDSFTVVMKYLLGNFNINYIGVDNAVIDIQTKSDSKISTYNVKRTDFSMHDVAVIDHPDSSIKVGTFDLGLMGYEAYDPDSAYQVKFDSIHFANEKIFLSNFTITPSKKIQTDDFRDIRMTSLAINQISWPDLLANRKIVADEIELIAPELKLVLPEKADEVSHKKKLHFLSAMKKIESYADVEKLRIHNAMLNISRGDLLVDLKDLDCSIPVNRLLQSESLNDLLAASVVVGFRSGKVAFNQNEILLKNGKYDGNNKLLFLKETFAGNNKNSLNGYFQNLMVRAPLESSPGHFDFSSLAWDKANISLMLDKRSESATKQKPAISIRDCNGSNTRLQIRSGDLIAGGNISAFFAKDVVTDDRGKFSFSDLSLRGYGMSMYKKSMEIMLSQFDFKNNQRSSVSGLIIRSDKGKNNVDLNFPGIHFSADLNKVLRNQVDLEYLDLLNPVVRLRKNDTVDVSKKAITSIDLPNVRVGKLNIVDPEIHARQMDDLLKPGDDLLHASLMFTGISMHHSKISFRKGNLSFADMVISTPKFSLTLPKDDSLKMAVHDVAYDLEAITPTKQWSFFGDSIQTGKLKIELKKDDGKANGWLMEKMLLTSMHFSSDNIRNPSMLFAESPDFRAYIQNAGNAGDKKSISCSSLDYNNNGGKLSLQGFNFKPTVDKERFVAMNEFQKDYPVFSVDNISFHGLSPRSYFSDSVISADKIALQHPDLYIYKDKRKPFKKGVYKHLPASGLKQLKMKFDIDTVELNDGNIAYEELNEKTGKSGKVTFSAMKAAIHQVKNVNHTEKDSLRIAATAKFMDSAVIRFKFSESFTDSLHAFNYGLRFRPFDLKTLNPILEPLVSARILSGSLDTLRLNAIGRENMSHGKIRMYYNGLKIQYLNKGSDSVKNLKSRLINFVANDLLLKRNNKKGYGIVYAERDKERGFANYWLKIGLSGVVSSSGVKKNKNIEKKYRRQLKKIKVPDIPEVDL